MERHETLATFVARQPGLSMTERALLVDQALLLVGEFYAHLPRKRMLRGIDPVRRLELLRERLPAIGSDASFHTGLCETLAELRDLHTSYVLPGEYASAVAMLPIALGCCGDAATPSFVVVSARAEARARGLVPGQEVLSWNGLPVARAVERLAWAGAGASDAAQRARAVHEMTLRPLASLPAPDEAEVVVGFRDAKGALRTTRLPWRVMRLETDEPPHRPHTRGLDLGSDLRRRARDTLRTSRPGPDDLPSLLPELLRARRQVADSPFGYLRIRSFKTQDAEAFVTEVRRLLALLPQEGLVLDVRDNGGGLVEAAERTLQLFSPVPVTPVGFQLLAGPATKALCGLEPELAAWAPSVARAVAAGTPYSDALPISDPAACNAVGRVYPGAVVLLVDPLCYSACDVFAAGFADHGIGRILGTGPTGGGGANVWPQARLQETFERPGSPFQTLPGGAGLRVALRRVLRSGASAGKELEENGVAPDELHVTTLRDLLQADADLLAHASATLATMDEARASAAA